VSTQVSAEPEPGSFFADGGKGKAAIALTFDDGPGEFTPRVLEILDRYQVKATFFMNGDQVEKRPEVAREVKKRGHEIGEHTYSHMNFYAYEKKRGVEKTREKIREEMARSKAAIEKTLGLSPRFCRMPHGYHRSWLGGIAKEFGYVLVNWTFGEDWHDIPEEKMTEDYLRQVRKGAILLFHDGGKNREKTLKIVPRVIEAARKKGLALATVGEILSD
jgi:peptidoglycan/xylan/chitin deacetylase (PgdA/CDA1 family)